jgi:hypothetical protein
MNSNQTATHDEHPAQESNFHANGETENQVTTDAPSTVGVNSWGSSAVTPRNTTSDVMETNLHTSHLEFYGSASSVAFLRHVETLSTSQTTNPPSRPPERSLVELLYNTDFQPDTSHSTPQEPRGADLNSERFHFRVARRYLDAYFTNIHYIQPIFEEEQFLARCEDLWFNRPGTQPLSFIALYYATMSLGCLVMTFDTPHMGADRFTWSRKLFNDALAIVTRLGTATDIEMVQCFYMLVSWCLKWELIQNPSIDEIE